MSLDPAGVVRAAAITPETVPERTYQPPPTAGDPDPAPVTLPAQTRLATTLDALPDILKPGGNLDLAAAVAVLWQLEHSRELRAVTGHVTLTATPPTIPVGTWANGMTAELPVTWDEQPPVTPTTGIVVVEAGVAWLGRTAARVKPGSITPTGCVVLATAVGIVPVTPSTGQPINYSVQGLYLFTPPLDLGEPTP